MAPMTLKDIIKELEMDGEANEALSFETVLKVLDDGELDAMEAVEDMPSLPKLLRQVHKAGFWHGAEFGRHIFLNIMEDERKTEVLEFEDWDEMSTIGDKLKENHKNLSKGPLGDGRHNGTSSPNHDKDTGDNI
jgi:hypothetical protein